MSEVEGLVDKLLAVKRDLDSETVKRGECSAKIKELLKNERALINTIAEKRSGEEKSE